MKANCDAPHPSLSRRSASAAEEFPFARLVTSTTRRYPDSGVKSGRDERPKDTVHYSGATVLDLNEVPRLWLPIKTRGVSTGDFNELM